MSEFVQAIILGIIQGMTEFLPVSSSGHLEIAKYILGDNSVGQESLAFTIAVHAATALSTLYVFRKDVVLIFRGLFGKPVTDQQKFALLIVLSMIPAALVGFLAEPLVASLFNQRMGLVGSMLIFTALLLYLADKRQQTDRHVTWLDAAIIGLAQAVAILPGISRSGATIATSVLLGIDRYEASRFSFLMVVPLILGKMCYDIIGGDVVVTGESGMALIAGFAAAFISGIVACNWMIRLVQKSRLSYFAMYCLIVGSLAILSIWIF